MSKFNDFENQKNTHQISKITEGEITQYVLDRFEEMKQNPTMSELINFHSSNKYLLMAHNQEKLKTLGNIVANHNKRNMTDLIYEYEVNLKNTLRIIPTVRTHINVLMHIFGFFKSYFSQEQKEAFLEHIKNYRENNITLGKILCEIEPLTYQINAMFLISQTYFLLYSESSRSNIEKITSWLSLTKKE